MGSHRIGGVSTSLRLLTFFSKKPKVANCRIMNSTSTYNLRRVSSSRRPESLAERPQKKIKPDAISLLAEMGLSNFARGDHCTAEKYFSQALSRSMNDLSEGAKSSKNQEWSNAEIPSECDADMQDNEETTQSFHDFDEGLHVFDKTLDIGPLSTETDSATSALSYNIAQTLLARGLHQKARVWFEKALDYSETPEMEFKILHNLGYTSYRCKFNDKALFFYRSALEMVTQLDLSVDMNILAATFNAVGVMYFHDSKSCNSERAYELLQQSLELYGRDYEKNKKEIAVVLNNIGRTYYVKSEFKEARESYTHALKIRRELFEEDSMDVAATLFNLGQAEQKLNDLDKAMECYLCFLQVAEAHLGPANAEVGLVFKCIGDIHWERSEKELSLVAYEKSLFCSRQSVGHSHPSVAAILNKAGNLCYEMKDYARALRYYKEGLVIEKSVLKPNHPHMIITLSNIAHVHKLSGEYAKALFIYRRVHLMQIKVFGTSSAEAAITLSNIGLMEYNLRDFDSAFDSYQEALQIRREIYKDESHLDIAATLNSLGLVLFKQNMFEMAKECFSKALEIRQELLGKNHGDVAILWYNMATTFFETGDDDQAIDIYKEALRIERECYGDEHPDVIKTIQHLGSIYFSSGRFEEALQHFQNALTLQQKQEKRNFRSEAQLLNQLGNLHLQNGKVSDAIESYIQAARILKAGDSDQTLHISGYNYYQMTRLHPPAAAVA